VVFAELNDISLSLIKHNVNMLGFNNEAKIVKCDVVKGFAVLQGKYDVVFIGPPYKDENKKTLALTYPALKSVMRYDILKDDSILITQKHRKESIGNVAGLECFRTEKYGDTVVSFYKRAKLENIRDETGF
jgi:16S rRNA G966 N2-methylase RsmD